MKKQRTIRKDNQGFTLVELIVVLVILAILAAILVPALLGYIDEAKRKQDVIDAKACMTAIQSELTKKYASYSPKKFDAAGNDANKRSNIFFNDPNVTNKDDVYLNTSSFVNTVLEKAGIEKPYLLVFFSRKVDLKNTDNASIAKDSYTVYSVLYWSKPENDPIVYNFDTNSWEAGNLYTCNLMLRGSGLPKGKEKNKVYGGKYDGHYIKHYIVCFDKYQNTTITTGNYDTQYSNVNTYIGNNY